MSADEILNVPTDSHVSEPIPDDIPVTPVEEVVEAPVEPVEPVDTAEAPVDTAEMPIETVTVKDIIYVKDNVDLGELVVDFLNDEEYYYSYIHSFSTERSTVLRIVDDKGERISSGILLHDDTAVLEVKRANTENFEREVHTSILEWYTSVCAQNSPFTELFDRVLIGKNSVPLWNALKAVSEEDIIQTEKDEDEDDDSPMSFVISACLVLFTIYLMLIYYIIDI
jgi:hypothetical protein